jgi:hypothetical protein
VSVIGLGSLQKFIRTLVHLSNSIVALRKDLWDIASHPFPVHHKLTQEHIFLTPEAKMRNHLAEDILNSDMLHLMELYQKNLGNEGAFLNATIELLKCTSVLINFCRDPRPITDTSDDRLKLFDFLETEACPRITEFMVWQ